MEDTNTDTINGLSEEKLRERLNFSKMFNRQEKQIQQTPHIKNLLSGQKKDLEENINKMEENYQMKNLDSHINELRADIQGLKLKNTYRLHLNLENEQTKKQLMIFAGVCTLILAISLFISGEERVIHKEKVVLKEVKIPAPVTSKVANTHFTLKYVNLRDKASSKGKVVMTIAPNTEIKVLETKYGWHKLEYKNHLKNKKVTAWAFGENIAQIKL